MSTFSFHEQHLDLPVVITLCTNVTYSATYVIIVFNFPEILLTDLPKYHLLQLHINTYISLISAQGQDKAF